MHMNINLIAICQIQAVLEMSQRQKEPQAADGQPPAGPNGELQFQPEAQKPEAKGKHSEIYVIYVCVRICSRFY